MLSGPYDQPAGAGAGERAPEQLLLTPTLGLSEPAQTQLCAKEHPPHCPLPGVNDGSLSLEACCLLPSAR